MVARKPQFPYVGKLLVVFNIRFVEMTVIVDNRQIRNAFVNSACGIAGQQKIFIKKSHFPFSLLNYFITQLLHSKFYFLLFYLHILRFWSIVKI